MNMRRTLVFMGIVFCFLCCNCNIKQNRIVFYDDFINNTQGDRVYKLDSIIQLSHGENKPLLLWFSVDGDQEDRAFYYHINSLQKIKEYLLDSMYVYRVLINRKTRITDIKSPEMKALLPVGKNFKTEGSIGIWINRTYFDSLNNMMVVTDHEFNRLSPCTGVHKFYEDSITFMNFLRKAKCKYDSLYRR